MAKIRLSLLGALCCLAACTNTPDEASTVRASEPTRTVSEPADPATDNPPVVADPMFDDLSVGDVVMTIDGTEMHGSGVAFATGDEILLRLLVGAPDEHLEFNLIGSASGAVFPIDTGASEPVVVIGLDAVTTDYQVVDATSVNQFTIDRVDNAQIAGTIQLSSQHRNEADPTEFLGRFVVELAETGDWDCDFTGPSVTDCRFG